MIVEIRTKNGEMKVDLGKFFPTTVPRARKLFVLMREGASVKQLREVKGYLEGRGIEAAKEKSACGETLRELEEALAGQERTLEQLREEKNRTQKRITEVRRQYRVAEQAEKMAPVWRKEFEYICGE